MYMILTTILHITLAWGVIILAARYSRLVCRIKRKKQVALMPGTRYMEPLTADTGT